MRRVIFLFALCVVFTTALNAQSLDPVPSFRAGARVGLNVYDIYETGRSYYQSEANAGFHAGVYGDYDFLVRDRNFTLRVEALFSTRGMYLSEDVDLNRVMYRRESSYFDFPVSLNYRVWKRLKVHAGVVPSLFLEEYRSISMDAEGFRVEEGDQFRSYERWQLGVLAGATYAFEVYDQQLEAGVRYSMGVTRTNELIREVGASRDPKYLMLQFYLTYKIFHF